MSSMRSIWSDVKRWITGLSSSNQSGSESDLRERLDQRVEAQKRKAEGVEELRKELQGARSDMRDLSGNLKGLEATSKTKLSAVEEQMSAMRRLVQRLGAELAEKETQLEQITTAAKSLSWRRELMTLLTASLVGLAPLLAMLSLSTNGLLPSVLAEEMRMSRAEIQMMESGEELRKARESLGRRDSVRLERLIQEGATP